MFEFNAPGTLFGMRMYEAPEPPPVIQIPRDFEFCSDEFRAAHNLWLLQTFGMREPLIKKGTALVSQLYGFAVMNKSDMFNLIHTT